MQVGLGSSWAYHMVSYYYYAPRVRRQQGRITIDAILYCVFTMSIIYKTRAMPAQIRRILLGESAINQWLTLLYFERLVSSQIKIFTEIWMRFSLEEPHKM